MHAINGNEALEECSSSGGWRFSSTNVSIKGLRWQAVFCQLMSPVHVHPFSRVLQRQMKLFLYIQCLCHEEMNKAPKLSESVDDHCLQLQMLSCTLYSILEVLSLLVTLLYVWPKNAQSHVPVWNNVTIFWEHAHSQPLYSHPFLANPQCPHFTNSLNRTIRLFFFCWFVQWNYLQSWHFTGSWCTIAWGIVGMGLEILGISSSEAKFLHFFAYID